MNRIRRLVPTLLSLGAALSGCGDGTVTDPAPGILTSARGVVNHHSQSFPGEKKAPGRKVSHLAGLMSHCKPLSSGSASKIIGPAGGELRIGPHTLTVPAGALGRTVKIRAKLASGQPVNVVEFTPDGLVFDQPARLSMTYANCRRDDWSAPLRIAVVDDARQILYYLPSTDDMSSRVVTGEVPHFSNYAVAW